jgi:outer membrane protein assembly factor BamB
LILGDHLYIQAGNAFVKVEKKTGNVVWRVLEEKGDIMNNGSFSSPVVAELQGVKQILVQTRNALSGVDPETGRVYWTQNVPNFRGMNILTPTVIGDSIFTSTYQNKAYLYRPKKMGDSWSVETVWENRTRGYMSSPVVIAGHVYLHNQDRRVLCIEAASGKTRWISTDRFGEYWSMVSNGDKILVLDQRGELLLMRANTNQFERMDKKVLTDQETWGHLAVAGKELFIRELRAIAKWEWS